MHKAVSSLVAAVILVSIVFTIGTFMSGSFITLFKSTSSQTTNIEACGTASMDVFNINCKKSAYEYTGADLVGYWKLNSVNSTNYTLDYSGHGNDGQLGGGSSSQAPQLVSGKIGNALQFDGIDDYVEVQDSEVLRFNQSITLMAWVKPKLCGNYTEIISKGNNSSTINFGISGIPLSAIITHSTDTDFNNGTFSQTTVNGTGTNAKIQLLLSFQWTRNSSWDAPDIGTWAVPTLADLDNDGDYDLIIGEYGGGSYAYENNGSASSPVWVRKTLWDIPSIYGKAAPALVDLDGDGDYDAMVGGIDSGLNEKIFAYENTGSASSPSWTRNSSWDISGPFDSGNSPVPAFADLDGDGDYDAIVGDWYGGSYAYENTGSSSSPVWTRNSSWDAPDIGTKSAPAFADLDNDGDYDLIIGEYGGISYAYENTGSASSPSWTRKSSWDIPDVGFKAAPAFADLDNDGDYDAMVGNNDGLTYGYENTPSFPSSGTFTSPIIDLPNIEFITLNWSETTSASTSIKFQFSSSNDNNTWTAFLGPDGTTSTYYTASGTQIWTGHSGNRYIKYKAYLETTNTSQTPELHNITINYTYSSPNSQQCKLYLSTSNSTGYVHYSFSGNSIYVELNNWNFVAGIATASQNGGNHTYYINGQNAGETIFTNLDSLSGNSENLTIGKSWKSNRLFNGTIDDVRIYNKSLSSSEILQHYNSHRILFSLVNTGSITLKNITVFSRIGTNTWTNVTPITLKPGESALISTSVGSGELSQLRVSTSNCPIYIEKTNETVSVAKCG